MRHFRYLSNRHAQWKLALIALLWSCSADAGVFEFAGDKFGVDTVTHPTGYYGAGGTITVTIGISPTSPYIAEMDMPLRNAIQTWNQLAATTGNVVVPADNIPGNHYDFESIVLHELGHCLGLGHPNLASESGVAGEDKDYTAATKGANGVYDLNRGADNIIGSSDDLRGDDIDLFWFYKGTNNPFVLPEIIDKTTYSRNLADLPVNDHYVANGDRDVATRFGLSKTEAVMQQGIQAQEARRTLTADDVATLRLAMSGLDMLAGTADDYAVQLQYLGITSEADIVIDFDNQAEFAECTVSGQTLGFDTQHITIRSGHISFNTGYSWYFNQNPTIATPSLPELAVNTNNSQESIALKQGDHLTVTISLNPTIRGGRLADYWVKASTPDGTYWLDEQFQFIATENPLRAYGGPLVNIPTFTVFDDTTLGLTPGTYIISFAVDDNINGIYDGSFETSITFTINP